MTKVAVMYGSTMGNTENIAEKIAGMIEGAVVRSVAGVRSTDFEDYDVLILGSSTWGLGDLQDDWVTAISQLEKADLKGKKVALFGLGDQSTYSDTFVDAIGTIYQVVADRGAEIVGEWSVDGYEHVDSKALKDGMFVGLALDEDCQPELTDKRVDEWVSSLRTSL